MLDRKQLGTTLLCGNLGSLHAIDLDDADQLCTPNQLQVREPHLEL